MQWPSFRPRASRLLRQAISILKRTISLLHRQITSCCTRGRYVSRGLFSLSVLPEDLSGKNSRHHARVQSRREQSAVEPYLRDDMSETERRIVTQWLGGLWSTYTQHAEAGRDLPEGEMDRFIADFGGRFRLPITISPRQYLPAAGSTFWLITPRWRTRWPSG